LVEPAETLSYKGTANAGSILTLYSEIRQGTTLFNRAVWPMIAASGQGIRCRITSSSRQVAIKGSVVWSVEVANYSSLPATDVRLMVNLPDNVVNMQPNYFSPLPLTQPPSFFGGYERSQSVFYEVGNLNPGAKRVYQFRTYPLDNAPSGVFHLVSANTDTGNGLPGRSSQAGVAFGANIPISPDIQVEVPQFTILADNQKESVSFGKTKRGKTRTKTAAIRNLGTLDLIISKITVSGTHAADWTVAKVSKNQLYAREGTSMKITFKPKGRGTRKAIIKIHSNDPNESPYEIRVSGTGQ
ncbi:MAG: choice-of-anchor D domain-containing protein, partial [Verrucomicrobiaceae bacterium]